MNLSDLNPAQQEAVKCIEAPSLVIAGAGSGKTRVLTYKVAYLLEHGYAPWNILALTFTNKAAREMQERVGQLVGAPLAEKLWMGTFHSIFARILRIESQFLNFTSDFTIYDADDSKNLLKAIIREMQLDDKQYRLGTVVARISSAKNVLMLPEAYANDARARRDRESNMPLIPQIYAEYVRRCRVSNVMDFDDLLLNTWLLFQQHPEILEKYQERFQFVLVDEYQDTNYAQHRIVWELTKLHQRVCVVGDDAQSIYSFRGAEIDNILNFQQAYNGARLFKLEQNYRSTKNIVAAANSLIHHNERQIRKEVFSQNDVGEPIAVCRAYSADDEANLVARRVREFARRGIPFCQMAVLYRTNDQSRILEETFSACSLPYRVYGGKSFYQRAEVKGAIAFFRLAVNLNDEEALKRVIDKHTRGIGRTTLDKVLHVASSQQIPVWDVLSSPELLDVNKGTQAKLESFRRMMETFHELSFTADAYTLGMQIVVDSGLRDEIFKGNEPEDKTKQENLQELLNGISSFVEQQTEQGAACLLTTYLQSVSLLSDKDEDETETDDKVSLMTAHSAKGLEFDVVFVVGLEENLFPSEMSMESPRGVEEERRLFYVAMTRARKFLLLTYARSRMRNGSFEFANPSRFLREIDSRFLRVENAAAASEKLPAGNFGATRCNVENYTSHFSSRGRQLSPSPQTSGFLRDRAAETTPPSRFVRVRPTASSASAPAATAGVVAGARIAHDRFGLGTVVKLEGSGLDAKATVRFDNAGEKTLLLRFAKFKVIS